MKRIIALRKRFKAFGRGSLDFLQPENRKVLAFVRHYENETILVVANLSRLAQHISLNLGEFNGRIPVEVFGQTDFPDIAETPYPITLSPYAFYWFSLEARQPAQIDLLTAPAEVSIPTLMLTGDWKDIYKRRTRPVL
jgi:maltose alpha-D-glucosyltransferase/alpha-amylase